MELVLILPVLLFSVVVHEVAHAWQALREGDPTARDLGRITLNPLPHLDPVGSLIVPLVLHFVVPGGLLFGWAKPVPVDPGGFRDPRMGDVRVSLAGIVSNLGLVVLCAAALAVLNAVVPTEASWAAPVAAMLTYGVFVNLALAWFNLIPVPPLDGSRVLARLLPPAARARYRSLGRYGVTLLFLTMLAFPGALRVLFAPVALAAEWILGALGG